MLITMTSIFVLAITYLLTRSHAPDLSQLSEARGTSLTLGIQIICGDCSGGDALPVKTYCDIYGNCAQCGGRSYILASHRFLYSQQLMMARLSSYESLTDGSATSSAGVKVDLRAVEFHKLTA